MAKGGKREGAGRKAGVPNKLTTSMKEAFLHVYESLQADAAKENPEQEGEHLHLFTWAKDSPTDFYRICSKLIPQQITADVRHVTAEDMDDAELADIAARGRAGTIKAESSKKELH